MAARLVAILAMMALILPLPATISAAAPPATLRLEECFPEQSAIALDRPSPEATLLAGTGSGELREVRALQEVHVVQPGDTLGALARRYNTTVGAIVELNGLANPNLIHVGQRLTLSGQAVAVTFAAVPLEPPLRAAWLDAPVVQGDTAVIWLRAAPGTSVTARLGSQTVPFRERCGLLWGLVAFDALDDEPGLHELTLEVRSASGTSSTARVPVPLEAGSFPTGRISFPAEKQGLLAPDVIGAENERLNALFAGLPDRPPVWGGPFRLPLARTTVTNVFGGRTVYSNGRGTVYHEGIDYRGRSGTAVLAAAPGTVVLAEGLTVRGNTVFLDHGGGVLTGYFHMSEIGVQPGQTVQAGETIGKVGTTGLSTGPHLHWEVRVNGRWVNPGPWLERSFP